MIEAPNAGACDEFGALIEEIPARLQSDEPANTMWSGLRDEFDVIALDADGETSERMAAFVDDWPDLGSIMVWGEVEPMNDGIAAVERSCVADGNTVFFAKLSEG